MGSWCLWQISDKYIRKMWDKYNRQISNKYIKEIYQTKIRSGLLNGLLVALTVLSFFFFFMAAGSKVFDQNFPWENISQIRAFFLKKRTKSRRVLCHSSASQLAFWTFKSEPDRVNMYLLPSETNYTSKLFDLSNNWIMKNSTPGEVRLVFPPLGY